MYLTSRMDDFGKPAWIVLTVLAFIVFWPVGLVILAYLIWSGRMAYWRHERAWRWHENGSDHGDRWQQRWERKWQRFERCASGGGPGRSSGNRAFDEYRAETLRRLEEEEKEFREFLDRLRFAKDKSEFDEFLNDRRRRTESQPPPSQV